MNDQLSGQMVGDVVRARARRLRRGCQVAGAALLVLVAGLSSPSCANDDFTVDRTMRPAPGPNPFVDAGADAEESYCPAQVPKIGENCPSDMENLIRCSFVVGVCEYQASSYDITVDYCCSRGTVWDTCGTNTTPCDRDPDAAAPDPVIPPDAGPRPDARTDAAPDVSPDA